MKLFLVLIISLTFSTVKCQDFVGTNYLFATFYIKIHDSIATAFLGTYKGNHYLVTAKHIFKPTDSNVLFEIFRDNVWRPFNGHAFFHKSDNVDIAILRSDFVSAGYNIVLDPDSSFNVPFGDVGFFLGFPYGYYTLDNTKLNEGYPIPLIKRATFSGSIIEKNVEYLFLDGFNNPGFSGGPVLFFDRWKKDSKNLFLVAVVSGYVSQINRVKSGTLNFDFEQNSGIIRATASRYIPEIIDSFNK